MGEDEERERLIDFFNRHEQLYQQVAEALMDCVEKGDVWGLLAHAHHLGEIVTTALNLRLSLEREARGINDASYN